MDFPILTLQSKWQQLERLREEVLAELSQWNPDQLAFRPAPDRWSARQILKHVVLAEYYTLRYMQKKRQAEPTLRAPWYSGVATALLKGILRSPLKFRIPSSRVDPGEGSPLEELSAEWQRIREEMQALLSSLGPEMARFPIYRHPMVGYQTPAQMLVFLYEHGRRHWRQIQALRNHPRFPADKGDGESTV